MDIEPFETEITGAWIVRDNKVMADRNCERIDRLTSSHLRVLTTGAAGWDTLYLNPSDGAYWECVYPQSNMHGGGPPQLRRLTIDQAKQKYSAWSFSEQSQ